MQQPPRKKSLVTCKLYSHLPRPRKSCRYLRRTKRAASFAVLQLGQGKRQEIVDYANRCNIYLLVDCSRVSPLARPPLSCRTSYSISGGSLYSRNKANRPVVSNLGINYTHGVISDSLVGDAEPKPQLCSVL